MRPPPDLNETVQSIATGKGFARSTGGESTSKKEGKDKKPADQLIESLGSLSNLTGRQSDKNTTIMGSDETLESWRELDEKVRESLGVSGRSHLLHAVIN